MARGLGVTALRITGGEPLVRKGLPVAHTRPGRLGFDDLAMTTNGTELAPVAAQLAAAGLRRVNVSCDSLRPDRSPHIRRRGHLDVVLKAMDAAEAAGLFPLKVNVVLLRGQNDDEILDFAAFARRTGRIVRFIEFMPLDAQGEWDRSRLVPGREVFERISAVWPLEPLSDTPRAGAGRTVPLRRRPRGDRADLERDRSRFAAPATACGSPPMAACGTACSPMTSERCATSCAAEGPTPTSPSLFRQAVWAKFPGHGINEPGFFSPARSMSMIGG